jgi:hypothetical protein
MKISIGINQFKHESDLFTREKLCLESLKKCKEKYSNIELYLLKQAADNISYNYLKTLEVYQDQKCPLVNTLLNKLAETDCDVFVLLNNDIVVNYTLFKLIDGKYDTYIASRAHLHELNSLEDKINPAAYSVHGFDLFAFNKKWWLNNRDIFPQMYIGRGYWDTVFFTKCICHSNALVINKQPPVIFHAEHHSSAVSETDYCAKHNETIASQTPEMAKWWNYVYNVLLKRPTINGQLWWQPHENEVELEKIYFK